MAIVNSPWNDIDQGRGQAPARLLALTLAAAVLTRCAPAPGPVPTPEPAAGPAPTFLIVGAAVYDGTGAPARPAEVRVRGERIEAVGALEPGPGEPVVNARGLALAPGFIDTHSHADRGLLRRHGGALGAVSQGITTVVVGVDGGHAYPLGDFFAALEATGVAVNVASYVGHGTLRRLVMGDDWRREATPLEVTAMGRLLRHEMEAGGLGLSTGLEYDPGIYASTEEVVALAREAAALGGRYASHMRSEDRALFEAVDELIHIGRETGIPVQVSHMKLAMKSLWGRADELIGRLEAARAEGIDVTADVYPYTYWQSTMTVLFPERDFQDRDAAAFALAELAPPEGMLIARYEPEPSYEGKTLAAVAEERGEDPVTTYMALIARAEAEDAGESIIATSMDEADVVRLLRWEHTNVASDGGLDGAHPRGFGAFTRVLGPYVRAGHLSLEDAVRKMTKLAAEHVGIEGRGEIRPGAYADLVLFDPDAVVDLATPEAPHRPSEGIARVWVNGVEVFREGSGTGARPGRTLRRGHGARLATGEIRAPGDPSARADLPTAAIDSVFSDFDGRDRPGCAVGVMRGDELVYARGYGMADLEHGVPITPRSVFRTGSVSKQFTAAAMVLLEQDGVISLDDPVRRWIPELPDYGAGFTIRLLLHHTSGVRDYLTLMDLAGYREQDWYSDDDVVAMLARQPELNFEPGAEFLYSNSGYFLLSQVVKRSTGKSLAEYAAERIFRPLGMAHTHYHDDPTRIVPDRAMGYVPAGNESYRISMTTLPMIGDGGVFTSIEDLAAWDRNLDDPVVGGPALVEAMLTRGVLNDGDTLAYALGLNVGARRGLRMVYHGGSFVGFRAATARFPDEGVSVYTLCNRADAGASGRTLRVADAVLRDRMEPAQEPGTAGPGRPARPGVDTLRLDPSSLRSYTGDFYSDVLDASYVVGLDGDTLRLTVGNGLDGPMAAVGEDVFRRGPLQIRFMRDGQGRVSGFDVDAGRVRGIRFEKVRR